jgi:hypothetical protein
MYCRIVIFVPVGVPIFSKAAPQISRRVDTPLRLNSPYKTGRVTIVRGEKKLAKLG